MGTHAGNKVSEPGAVFKEFRRDGWPLCPRCGDDELYSHYLLSREGMERAMGGEQIPLEELLRHPFGCYYCRWTGQEVETREKQ